MPFGTFVDVRSLTPPPTAPAYCFQHLCIVKNSLIPFLLKTHPSNPLHPPHFFLSDLDFCKNSLTTPSAHLAPPPKKYLFFFSDCLCKNNHLSPAPSLLPPPKIILFFQVVFVKKIIPPSPPTPPPPSKKKKKRIFFFQIWILSISFFKSLNPPPSPEKIFFLDLFGIFIKEMPPC